MPNQQKVSNSNSIHSDCASFLKVYCKVVLALTFAAIAFNFNSCKPEFD
ncbi:MAG: hypothetical protein ACI9NN_002186 [Bacteroidia bacterium]|jgi:hypothetical protein